MSDVVLVVLLFVSWLIGFAAYMWRDHAQWRRLYGLLEEHARDRRDLLNRVMARDYAQFVQAEAAQKYGEVLQRMMQGQAPQQEEVGI